MPTDLSGALAELLTFLLFLAGGMAIAAILFHYRSTRTPPFLDLPLSTRTVATHIRNATQRRP